MLRLRDVIYPTTMLTAGAAGTFFFAELGNNFYPDPHILYPLPIIPLDVDYQTIHNTFYAVGIGCGLVGVGLALGHFWPKKPAR